MTRRNAIVAKIKIKIKMLRRFRSAVTKRESGKRQHVFDIVLLWYVSNQNDMACYPVTVLN